MDEQLLLMINQGWAHPWLDLFFAWVSTRVGFAAPMLAIIFALLYRSHGRNGLKLGVLLVLVIALGDQIANLLKELFSQPRPCAVLFEIIRQPGKTDGISCGAMTTGMPSSHASNYFMVAILLGITLRSWRWAIPLLCIAVIVGLSRIYLGVHFPSQVLVGSLLGIFIGLLVALAGVKYAPFIQQIRTKQELSRHD